MSDKDTAQWTAFGHAIDIGPVEAGDRDRFGKVRWHRNISIDGNLIAQSQGRDLMRAKWLAAEELERLVRRTTK